MTRQCRFDLCRIRIETADDEHVTEAIGDAEVAQCVDPTDVARVEPAAGIDRLGRGLGIIQVAGHQVVPAHHDFACGSDRLLDAMLVDDAQLDPADHATGRLGDQLDRVARPAHGHDTGRLGDAVRGDHVGEAELAHHSFHEHRRYRRRAGDRQSERAEVELAAPRVRQQRLVDGRWTGQHRDLLGLDARHHLHRIEHRLREHGRAHGEAGEHAGLVPRDVKERADDAVPVALYQPDVLDPLASGPTQSVVAQHRSFGCTGSARGELHVADVVGVHVDHVTARAHGIEQLGPCELVPHRFAP